MNATTSTANIGNSGMPQTPGSVLPFGYNVIHSLLMFYLTVCHVFGIIQKSRRNIRPYRQETACFVIFQQNTQFIMYLCLAASGLLTLVHLLLAEVSYMVKISPVFYSAVAASSVPPALGLYAVLWLRQAAFHMDPAINHLTNSAIKYFSSFQGVFIVVAVISFPVIIAQQTIQRKCVTTSCIPGWIPVSVFAAELQVEIALLMLFVYPLLKHRQNMRDGGGINQRGQLSAVKRAAVVTALSICTDACCISLYLLTRFGPIISSKILLNHVCIIFCFPDWREKLLPCYFVQKRRTEPETRRNETVDLDVFTLA